MMNICILLNDRSVSWWQAKALEYMLENCDVEITMVVYNEHDDHRTKWETLKRAVELREWAIAGTLNRILRGPKYSKSPVPIDEVIDRDSVVESSVEPNIVEGWKQEIPTSEVSKIAETADVAIRFGFGFLVGPILSELEYGVLSFHHGDIRRYRGQPMGFWEFVHGEETAGITVQQLSDELDAGKVAALKTVDISDLYTWGAVKYRLFNESEDMLATALQSLQNDDLEEPDELGTLYTHPMGFPVLRFAIKNTKGHILELF